jgi:quinol monooxygenase YgiN
MKSKPNHRVKVMSALLTAQAGKQGEFLQTIQSLRKEIILQEGCLECAIGRDAEDESRFLIFMVWKDLAHLEAHMDSEAFRILLGATSVLTTPSGFRFIAADSASRLPEDSEPTLPRSEGQGPLSA